MESSKEKIEAQLCAYVEGELDDAQRAEIEQHLAANPQHKALIAELRAASGLLRDLPRVSAPIELNESLCGQLERSALLNPSDDDSNPSLAVNRWPQFTAVAAVLILAIGLGLVVYYVLPPSGQSTHGQVALDDKGLKHAAPLGDSQSNDPEKRQEDFSRDKDTAGSRDFASRSAGVSNPDTRDSLQSDEKLKRSDENELARNRALASAGAAPGHDLNVARPRGAEDKGLVTAAEVENVRKWMKESLGSEENFFKNGSGTNLYLVISTNNAVAANSQLAAYFKTNGIQYMENESVVPSLTNPASSAMARGEGDDRAYGAIVGKRDAAKNALNLDADSDHLAGRYSAGGGSAGPTTQSLGFDARRSVLRAGTEPAKKAEVAENRQAQDQSSTTFGLKVAADKPEAQLENQATTPGIAAVKPPNSLTTSAPNQAGEPAPTSTPAVAEAKGITNDDHTLALGKPAEPTVRGLGRAAPPVDGAWDFPTESAQHFGEGLARNSVIVARMNRRQVNELSAALSREQGQHAQLKEFGRGDVDVASTHNTPIVGEVPAPAQADSDASAGGSLTLDSASVKAKAGPTAPGERYVRNGPATGEHTSLSEQEHPLSKQKLGVSDPVVAQRSSPSRFDATTRPTVDQTASDALRLNIDPLDEPVDVVIVVEGTTPAAPAKEVQKK